MFVIEMCATAALGGSIIARDRSCERGTRGCDNGFTEPARPTPNEWWHGSRAAGLKYWQQKFGDIIVAVLDAETQTLTHAELGDDFIRLQLLVGPESIAG